MMGPSAGDTPARNLSKFLSKFLHLCVGEQYPSNITSTRNHRKLLENLREFLARVSPVLRTGP